MVRRLEPRARLHGHRHRPPCRRLDRNLFHQPAARNRAAGADGNLDTGRKGDPPAAVRVAQGNSRIRRPEPHPLPGGFVEPVDQIPAQQDPAGADPPHPRNQPQVHEPDEPQPRAPDRRPAVHQPRHRTHPLGSRHLGHGDRHDPSRPPRSSLSAGIRDLRTVEFGLRIQGRRDRRTVPLARTGRHGTAVLRPRKGGLDRPRKDRHSADSPRRRVSDDGAQRRPAQLLRQLGPLLRILRHRHDQEFRRSREHRADRRRPPAIPAHAAPLARRRLVRAVRHDGPQKGVGLPRRRQGLRGREAAAVRAAVGRRDRLARRTPHRRPLPPYARHGKRVAHHQRNR